MAINAKNVRPKLKRLQKMYAESSLPFKNTRIMAKSQYDSDDKEAIEEWLRAIDNEHDREQYMWNLIFQDCNKLYKMLKEKA